CRFFNTVVICVFFSLGSVDFTKFFSSTKRGNFSVVLLGRTMSRVAVIGGGISGLSTAHFLKQWSKTNKCWIKEVTVFEKSNRFGGWIGTTRKPITIEMTDGKVQEQHRYTIHVEHGPNSMRGGKSKELQVTWQLIDNINLKDECVPAHAEVQAQRLVYCDNKVVALSAKKGIQELALSVWPNAIGRLWQINKGANEDEPLYEFCKRHFGKRFTDTYITAFVNGIYGGGIHSLSAQCATPFNQLKN
ncbi:protoporphyrinogen oxidase (predicted), partial [Reticulomyxa filosa]